MRLVPLQNITLISSNVSGSTYAEWSATHGTYNAGDNVKITNATTGLEKEYECLVTHTAAADKNPETDTTDWLYLGASNKWKMFDTFVNTQTQNSGSIEVTIEGEAHIDSVVFFNLYASSVQVVTKSGTTILSDNTYDLSQDIADWYEYFFSEFDFRSTLYAEVPGLYPSLTVDVTITAAGTAPARCGMVCMGRGKYLGDTQYGLSYSIEDYSVKDTNVFGETYLNQRPYSKKISADLWLTSGQIDVINKALATVRATPCVWQFNNPSLGETATDYESLIIYGFSNDFSTVLQGPIKSACSLEIEGLI